MNVISTLHIPKSIRRRSERVYIVTVLGTSERIPVHAPTNYAAIKVARERLRRRGIEAPTKKLRAVLRTPTPLTGGWGSGWVRLSAHKDIDSI